MPLTKSKTVRIAAAAVALLLLYALAGFWWAPKILRKVLLEQIPMTLVGVTPGVGEIRVNPFSMQVEMRNFRLIGDRGTTLAGFGRFFVEFELSSIWHRAYSFSRIEIDTPYANAIVAKDGRLNLAQLSRQAPETSAPKTNGSLPAVRIGTFKVTAGLLTYEDESHPSEFAARLEPIEFELQDFTTGVDGGRFTFAGSSKQGEHLEWHGHVSVQPLASDGEFRVDALQARTIWEYLKDRLNFQINSGRIDVTGSYQFALHERLELTLDLAKAELANLTVRPRDSETDWITVPELILSGTHLDLGQRHALTESLSLSGLQLQVWRESDGSVNLLQLAAIPATPVVTPGSPRLPTITTHPAASSGSSITGPASTAATRGMTGTPGVAATPNPVAPPAAIADAPWQFDLHEFALRDASISAEDRATRPAAQLMLAPLTVTAQGISLNLAKAVSVALATKINGTGCLEVSGDLTPEPLAANLGIKLKDFPLAAVQPYIAEHTSMTLLSGALAADLKVSYGAKRPALEVAGNLSVGKLHTIDNALHDDFINWDFLSLQGLNFQQQPDKLSIDSILARKLYTRVIIEPDSSINLTRVLAGPGATLVAPAGPGGDQVTATAAVTAPVRPATLAATAGSRNSASHAKAARAPASGTAVTSASRLPTPAVMPMEIRKIVFEGGLANFADLSITPNFAANIQNLEGTVSGLSSREDSRAKIDIHGSVDAFAPVAISGEVNVLSATLYTDLALSFRNIELSTFNPYSGKFAGYDISKGKLTTELHYKVDDRKLDAQHHIIVDQLEFGEKTGSKDAVSLPVKLAVALLKDRNGVIDLNLPVTGTLDDPNFRLGPIIWKVFVNILEKAVTAPFALLGSLFGGGPDLQYVDFQPGVADLNAEATDKTKVMIKALAARPQLKVEVPIAVVSELDEPSLVETKFQAQISEVQAAAAARTKSSAVSPSFDQLAPVAQLDLLVQVYAKVVGGGPPYPESVTASRSKADVTAAKIQFLTQEVHARLSVSDSELRALGEHRALNLQQALLTDTQIDPARVFLVANDKAKNDRGLVRLEFSLR